MAQATECQTDGAEIGVVIREKHIMAEMYLPFKLVLTDEEKQVLKANLHNAIELVMSKYFVQVS